MAKIYFVLRTQKVQRDDEAPIWARIVGGRQFEYRATSTLTIPIKHWNSKNGCVREYSGDNKALAERLRGIDKRLNAIRHALLQAITDNEVFTPAIAKETIANCLRGFEVKVTAIPKDIAMYCDYVISEMQSGARQNKGRRYAPNSIKAWRSFAKLLKAFLSKRHYTWDSLNVEEFKQYLINGGYLNKTINKYVTTFKTLCAFAFADGLHHNADIAKVVYREKTEKKDKTFKPFLTLAELEALYKMHLPAGSLKDKVRDVFLCGCYMGQRISDYGRISPEMFRKTANGYDVVSLTQVKTGTTVTIPVLSQYLTIIFKKYDYQLPRVCDQVLNRYIKEILRELSQTVPSLAERSITLLTMKEREAEAAGKMKFERDAKGNVWRPKWEMVSSHTARRTCITNLYITGLFDDRTIMAISGHKSQESFEGYICLSSEMIAERIAQKFQNMSSNNQL